MSEPNPYDPLDVEIANLMLYDYEEFKKKVKEKINENKMKNKWKINEKLKINEKINENKMKINEK